MKELTEVILNSLLSFGYDKTFTHTVILSMMRLYHRSTLIGDRRTRKSETRVINSSRLRRRGEHSTADLYSPFRAINLTTFDPVSLSVCQECRPSCRASRPMIDHPSRSVLSAVRYRSFAAIDVDLDFVDVLHLYSNYQRKNFNSVVLGSTIKWYKKGRGTCEIPLKFHARIIWLLRNILIVDRRDSLNLIVFLAGD